ncbi:hypothetical protein [Bradyrhizobium barranii]
MASDVDAPTRTGPLKGYPIPEQGSPYGFSYSCNEKIADFWWKCAALKVFLNHRFRF